MKDAVYSVTCPHCNRRQIVELNSQNYPKRVPIVYPVSLGTIIGSPPGPVSYKATTHVSNAKQAHEHVQNLDHVSSHSFDSAVSAFNILAFIKVIRKWFEKKEKFGWNEQNKQDPWITVTCNKCRSVYLYNHQIRDYRKMRTDV